MWGRQGCWGSAVVQSCRYDCPHAARGDDRGGVGVKRGGGVGWTGVLEQRTITILQV